MKKLLTLHEVAELLNVGYPRAAKLVRLGLIPVIRLGRHWRVDPVKLEEFLDGGGAALPDTRGRAEFKGASGRFEGARPAA